MVMMMMMVTNRRNQSSKIRETVERGSANHARWNIFPRIHSSKVRTTVEFVLSLFVRDTRTHSTPHSNVVHENNHQRSPRGQWPVKPSLRKTTESIIHNRCSTIAKGMVFQLLSALQIDGKQNRDVPMSGSFPSQSNLPHAHQK